MQCKKCRAELPDGSRFCCACGVRQDAVRRAKTRGNGQGSVFQTPDRKWKCVKTIGYVRDDKAGKLHRKTKSRQGFATKREALACLAAMDAASSQAIPTFKALYDRWEPTHRAGASTMGCYHAAIQHFQDVYFTRFDRITIDDLQDCLDDCPRGKRTRENMKALAGLLYKYAIPRHMADINLGTYLIVDGEGGESKEALPLDALARIGRRLNDVPGADYVYCHCYLGFRPSELLDLDARCYDRRERAFVGGAKTEAGRDRVVTVSPKIQPIIDRLTADRIAGPVFCAADGSRMSIKAYRAAFYRVLEACGVENPIVMVDGVQRRKYTPHCCRRTFATLMKRVDGADKDKLELIGHSSTEMLRYYQATQLEDLRKITDAL